MFNNDVVGRQNNLIMIFLGLINGWEITLFYFNRLILDKCFKIKMYIFFFICNVNDSGFDLNGVVCVSSVNTNGEILQIFKIVCNFNGYE